MKFFYSGTQELRNMKGNDPTKRKLPVLFPGPTPKQTLPREELVAQFLRNSRRAKLLKTGEGLPLNILAEGLGRPMVWVVGVQKRFGLPVLERYPEGCESFLRKVVHLRVLGVSEETLREFWAVERKLIAVLHLDPQTSPTWMVDACAYPSDPDRRLLLSNIDLGFPLPATDLQIGLNFASPSLELFAGKEMGEDALRLISDYRTRLSGIRSTVASELPVLKGAIKWGKELV
jgi:hypothetical protein